MLSARPALSSESGKMDNSVVISNSTVSRSYDAVLHGRVVGTIVYELRDNRMIIRHTMVDPQLRGTGIAKALAKQALDDLAASGGTLTNYCGFIADYIDRNPGYASLIDPSRPATHIPRMLRYASAGKTPDSFPAAEPSRAAGRGHADERAVSDCTPRGITGPGSRDDMPSDSGATTARSAPVS
jgi:predicted GNAT family acetyltransferase